MPRNRTLPAWADALWLGCLALYIMAGAAIMPFHGDESTLMVMGRDYYYIAVERDLDKVIFNGSDRVNPHEQDLRILNGTVSKYIYGWLQWLNGFAPLDLNRDWHWGWDYDYNLERGTIPDMDLLRQARLSSALQLALAAAAFFQFVKLSLDRPTAYLAAALFALHPNMLINGRRAMMEGSHILGLMLVLLAGIWLIKERRWRQYILLGFCAGLSIAAKHPNVIVCALVYLACAREPIWQLLLRGGQEGSKSLKALGGLALACAIAIMVFLLLNQAWWREPLEVAQSVVKQRQGVLQSQVNMFGGYESFAEQVNGFFEFVFVGARQYFEVEAWTQYEAITAQIADYERSGLAGALFIGASGRQGLLVLLLSLYGALMLLRDDSFSREARWLLAIWMAGSALATLWLTPLPWARYYLPLLPAVIMLVSYALVRVARMLLGNPISSADGIALLD